MTTVAEQSIKPPINASDVNFSEYSVQSGEPYDYIRKRQQSGLADVEITTSGGTNVDFLIDSGSFVNFAKSYFSFYYSLAGITAVYPFMHATGAGFISSMTLTGTSSGSQLLNCTNVNKCIDYLMRRDLALTDVMSRDCPNPTGAQTQVMGDNFEGLTIQSNYNRRPNGDIKGGMSISGDPFSDGGAIEPSYFMVNETPSGNIGQNFRLQFADIFKHYGILGLDKVIMMPEQLRLTITLAPQKDVAFTHVNLTISGTPITPASSGYLKNFTLNLAQCQNPVVKQRILSEVQNGGVKLLCENVHSTSQNLTGSQQTVQLRLQPGLGSSVSKISMIPMNVSANPMLAYEHSNLKVVDVFLSGNTIGGGLSGVGSKITSYYTQINNVRVNRSDYDTTKLEDWYEVRGKLRGSCISNSLQFNSVWGNDIDFTGPANALSQPTLIPEENQNQGMPLTEEKLVEMNCTTGISGNSLNWLSLAILKRHISITPQGFFSTV